MNKKEIIDPPLKKSNQVPVSYSKTGYEYRRLRKAEKVYLLGLISQFYKDNEIVELFEKQFGWKLPTSKLTKLRYDTEYREVWRELRKKWIEGIADEWISQKRVRLRKLQEVYEKAMTPTLSQATKHGKIFRRDLKAAALALEAARREMEGEGGYLVEDEKDGRLKKAGVLMASGERLTEDEWKMAIK